MFVFDPHDRSNALPPHDPDYRSLAMKWQRCPPSLKEAFERAFTGGLVDPDKRVQATLWCSLFERLKDSVTTCDNCGVEMIVDAASLSDEPTACWRCGTTKGTSLAFVIQNKSGTRSTRLPVFAESKVRRAHVAETASDAERNELSGRGHEASREAEGLGFAERRSRHLGRHAPRRRQTAVGARTRDTAKC